MQEQEQKFATQACFHKLYYIDVQLGICFDAKALTFVRESVTLQIKMACEPPTLCPCLPFASEIAAFSLHA